MREGFPEGPLTILFSDVEGSTDLRTERGDAVAHRILRSHEEVVRSCVEAHDGREVKALGDGFMVAFVSARKALTCAIAIQRGLDERNREAPGEELAVRIGINTGEVVVEGDDVYGQAVNAAARIAARARGGEILVSEIVRQLAGSGPEFSFVDRGRCRLKGFPDRWHLYGLVHSAAGSLEGGLRFAERTPFVGRQRERLELGRLVEQIKAGTGALVMIGGEPGVGKTRLSEEVASRCVREGFQTFVGHCYEMAGAQPYIPIVEAFEQALAEASSPHAFRQFLGDEAPEVARLVPKLRQLCPDIPPPLDLPAEQERRYLFNSVWEVLSRTGRARPTLLVLDDIHWADEPTMLLIQHLAERVAEVPVLMVGLYRDSELDVGRPLSRTFEELTRRRLARRLPLQRMPQEDVAQMLRVMAGQEPPSQLVDVLYSETEGNPFFTEEVFKHLAEEGRLFDADGRFRTDLSLEELDVPEGVRMVVGARLRRLGEEGPRVLGTAAVLGRIFPFELLQALEEMPEDALLDLVEEAERARLIFTVDDGQDEDRFIFAHELIRQTVLGEISTPRRRRLHARAAEALERVHAGNLEPQAATIAQHLLDAGPAADPKRTFRYLFLAGRWAQETAAFEEALTHLERAAERMEFGTPSERAELLFQLGMAHRSTGSWTTAIDAWRQSLDAYEELGDDEAVGRICVQVVYSLLWVGRIVEGVEVGERGLAVLGERVSADRARLLASTGMCASYAGNYQAATDMVNGGITLATALGDDAVLGHALFNECLHRWAWVELDESVEAGQRAVELLLPIDLFAATATMGFITIALVHLGRLEESRRVARELKPLAERIGNYPALLQVLRGGGVADFVETGDVEGLAAFGQADLEFCQKAQIAWVNMSLGWLGLADFYGGRWQEARANLEEGKKLEPPGALEGWNTGPLFDCLAYLEAASEALALLEARNAELPRLGEPKTWGSLTLLLSAVEGLAVLGQRGRAAELHPLVVEAIARTRAVTGSFFDGRLIERAAGIAAAAAGHWDDAEGHFRKALRQAAEVPNRPEAAHTRRFFAEMLLERDGPGDGAEATRLLAEAGDLYRQMGMPKHVAMVEAMGQPTS
jgi:class 3 adenylate cyclase/tetratricopeptide (TPR) repeat protein